MDRRGFLKVLAGLPGLLWWRRAAAAAPPKVTRIAFGSCADQDLPQPVWRAIRDSNPDVFVFLGDNIYGDTEDMAELAAKYRKLEQHADFRPFRASVPLVGTWDDHDYGVNDGGAEYPMKRESKELFLEFLREPARSSRRQRDGVYTSHRLEKDGKVVQVILLDLRWFRSAVLRDASGAYYPNPDPDAILLGEEQWAWLESELRQPADVRVLASSIQLVAEGHRWEKWANFPFERLRLYDLLDRLDVRNLVVVSGDMHYAELSSMKTPGGIPVFDLTSSGLNYSEPADGINNIHRDFLFDQDANFGLVTVEWGATASVRLELRDQSGRVVLDRRV